MPVPEAAHRAGYIRSLVSRQLDRLSKMEKRRRSTGEERDRMEREEEEAIAAGSMDWVETDVEGIAEAKVSCTGPVLRDCKTFHVANNLSSVCDRH